jgi:hypothetical protein
VVDPYAVLGLAHDATAEQAAAAYRELAKQWHPDRRGEEGKMRMAEINVAYDLLRSEEHHGASAARASASARPRGNGRAGGIPDAVRRALGPELLEALNDGETVRLVTPASTWASPRTILALTDRRLLWLLDDAPVARVRSINLRDVTEIACRARRPRRRVHTLQLRTTNGRRHTFGELRPHTAATIERHLHAAVNR